MKIGVILPLGRMDKYGYQYDDLIKLIIDSHENFADQITAVSSSRHNKNELFENRDKINFISNENTWFRTVNGEEEFSFKVLVDMLNLALEKLREDGFDIALLIHINQYIPKSSIIELKKVCQRLLRNNKPYSWIYKMYLCRSLLFNADRKLPWILNLNLFNHIYAPDSIIQKDTKEVIKIQAGNYKKHNNSAILDIPWEMTLQDEKEKYDFTIKEKRILNNTFDPSNKENLKFNEKVLIEHTQTKINSKKLVKKPLLDDVRNKIMEIHREDFVSTIYEKNYKQYHGID